MEAGDFFDIVFAQPCLLGEDRPVANGIGYFFKNFIGIVELQASCEGQEILLGRGCRSVDGGDMDALSARAWAWSDVVGGGLALLAAGIHEEAEIFGMVVPVSRQNVEGGAAGQFAQLAAVACDPQNRVRDDLVGKSRGLMVDMSEAGKGVLMELRSVHRTVEPSHGKESPFAFRCVDFKQTGFGHADAGGCRHEGVGVFHAPLLAGVLVRVRNG